MDHCVKQEVLTMKYKIIGLLKSPVSGMLIFLSALKQISKELYEAAVVDGANGWKKFWKMPANSRHSCRRPVVKVNMHADAVTKKVTKNVEK